ncbi:hypothetical protein [Nocardia cyriacigeorgica]|uniref:hypothetical protein n=1 Tax=Nocardia cyriacigeorgica TaxID=135487 RepID=UPI001893327B|nr:hypothetical protein [Nocardia cyriacigeorgica]MBF6435662.1 hypothetical protein [Nocardia cyriacigeorgica]MBF6454258.1 hypothetical protein [Nocardia cyriacigeorgica]MBF6477893.1 hypothetical protein [Nocardia cyriacigeorgica]MBF6552152.1 hypothetical protein [Nocardia cyriacigeorgica]
MNWDMDGELADGPTPQESYYARLRFLQRYPDRYPKTLEKMLVGGPPPPTHIDGCMGMVLWFEHNPPSPRDSNRLLDRMCAEGLLTPSERGGIDVPLSHEALAECKRRLDVGSDRMQRP